MGAFGVLLFCVVVVVFFFFSHFVFIYRRLGKEYFFGKFFAFGSSVLLLPHVSAVDA